jgi:predicted nucleotidyltransferase component of viral defense system
VKRPVTNVAASVRQRLLNEAKRRGESFDYVVSLFARERFLARLSLSPHRDRLTLKGATVFAVWLLVHRPTRDLDFLGSGDFEPATAIGIIRDILGVAVEDDGLAFDAGSVSAEPIREPEEYHGVRIHLEAVLDTARIRLQIDIGLGDVVTPPARLATLPAILADFSKPRVKVYPAETIVAEKLHAMVKLGIANSRMKDFFDVYVLARTREFDEALLTKAVGRTFERRRTVVPEEPFALTAEFYSDGSKRAQWRAFLTKSGVDAPVAFTDVGDVLRAFLSPVLSSARSGVTRERHWRGGAWRNMR